MNDGNVFLLFRQSYQFSISRRGGIEREDGRTREGSHFFDSIPVIILLDVTNTFLDLACIQYIWIEQDIRAASMDPVRRLSPLLGA